MIYDLHCHLDFAPNARAVAAEAEPLGIRALSATVTPAGYRTAREALGNMAHLRVGLGLHPWWVADGRCGEDDLARFEQLAPAAPWIGEVGLDFAGARAEGPARDVQLRALARVFEACAGGCAPKLISLHAVRAASQVLDALERHDVPERHACVFHWFSGTSDELTRAVRAGCYFSVNAHMLATKRGRAYARSLPANRLLLETDSPEREGVPWSAQSWRTQLVETLALLAKARGEDAADLAPALARTSARLLNMS